MIGVEMSNFSINKIYIFGDIKTLDLLKNKIGTKKKPLVGSKVSKKWIDARIEDLMFEEYNEISNFITDYKIPILKNYQEIIYIQLVAFTHFTALHLGTVWVNILKSYQRTLTLFSLSSPGWFLTLDT